MSYINSYLNFYEIPNKVIDLEVPSPKANIQKQKTFLFQHRPLKLWVVHTISNHAIVLRSLKIVLAVISTHLEWKRVFHLIRRIWGANVTRDRKGRSFLLTMTAWLIRCDFLIGLFGKPLTPVQGLLWVIIYSGIYREQFENIFKSRTILRIKEFRDTQMQDAFRDAFCVGLRKTFVILYIQSRVAHGSTCRFSDPIRE